MAATPRIALVGEARGEFLFLRQMAERLDERFGAGTTLQIEMDPRDLNDDERGSVLVPALEPEFAAALRLPSEELPGRIAEAESTFGIPNLRRLWLQDILRWRDRRSESELARQALGYVAVFDRLFATEPSLVGGFFEESARMVKRIFRAVAIHHGRRSVISIVVPTGGVVLVDQETFDEGLSVAWASFEPTAERLADARAYVESVRTGEIPFGAARDLSISPERVARLASLVTRQLRPRQPGDHNLNPAYFVRDFAQQRVRVARLRRVASGEPTGRGVLYPLHASFDSQLTVRGEPFRNQVALGELIAESLPFGYELWIKPHPYAVDIPLGRLTELQRRLDNVRLVHPTIPLRLLLRRASALVTVNSTSGFEALAAGVPVVTLGIGHYRGRGLTHDVTSPFELPAALARAVKDPPPSVDDVARLVAWLQAVSYDMTTMGWDLSRDNSDRFADALADQFALA